MHPFPHEPQHLSRLNEVVGAPIRRFVVNFCVARLETTNGIIEFGIDEGSFQPSQGWVEVLRASVTASPLDPSNWTSEGANSITLPAGSRISGVRTLRTLLYRTESEYISPEDAAAASGLLGEAEMSEKLRSLLFSPSGGEGVGSYSEVLCHPDLPLSSDAPPDSDIALVDAGFLVDIEESYSVPILAPRNAYIFWDPYPESPWSGSFAGWEIEERLDDHYAVQKAV